MHGIVIAGLAMTLSTAAYQDRMDRGEAQSRDDSEFAQRIRGGQDSGRRICAVDRLAESRLPRTICRTAHEWRDRQFLDLRKE